MYCRYLLWNQYVSLRFHFILFQGACNRFYTILNHKLKLADLSRSPTLYPRTRFEADFFWLYTIPIFILFYYFVNNRFNGDFTVYEWLRFITVLCSASSFHRHGERFTIWEHIDFFSRGRLISHFATFRGTI